MRQGLKEMQVLITVLTGMHTDWQDNIPDQEQVGKDNGEWIGLGEARRLAKTLGR